MLLALLVLAGGLATERLVEQEQARATFAEQRGRVQHLADLRGSLEKHLGEAIYLAHGVEAFVRAKQGRFDGEELRRMLRLLRGQSPLIRNIGVAPHNRLRYVEPLEGNEAVLGVSYVDLPEQWPIVRQVMETGEPVLAGPVQLVQGGRGLIHRLPVRLAHDTYWGMVSTVVDVDRLWAAVADEHPRFATCTILGRDAGAFPEEPVRATAEPPGPYAASIDVAVPGGSWRLVLPSTVAAAALPNPWLLRTAGWGVTLLLLALFWHQVQAKERLARANSELAAARDAAELAAVAKSRFLAMMSHEIRTPMNGVIGMTQLLLDEGLSDTQQDYARTAKSSAEALMVILDDILDQSKIESGRLTLEDIDFDLVQLVEDTVDLFSVAAQQKGLQLVTAIDPKVPPCVGGDPTRLRQILGNLCGNAVKFTERGHVVVSVGMAANGMVELVVRDSGIGIEPAVLAQLFVPFQQADSSTKRRFGGTGLGLVIARQIARLMGGDVEVDSEVGVGTTFRATVRLRSVDASRVPPPALRCAGPLVLASGERHQADAIAAWLWSFGIAPSRVDDAPGLLRCVEAAPAGVTVAAVVDCELPGWESLAAALQQHERSGRLRVCVLSSQVTREDRCWSVPAVARIHKPVRVANLVVGLRALLPGGTAAAGEQPVLGSGGPDLQGRRVLVVEDNVVNQRVAVAMLDRFGMIAELAVDGDQALARLADRDYDLVLLDMQMPGRDGPDVARAIRRGDAGVRQPDVRIIALTANALDEHREQCLAAGMDDFVTKPLTKSSLRTALLRNLGPV